MKESHRIGLPPSTDRLEAGAAGRGEPLRLLVLPPPRPAGMLTDRRVLVIGFVHAIGVAAAAVWLFARVGERLQGAAFCVERAVQILRNMRSGPEFYLFAGVALAGSVLLLIAARPWVEPRDPREAGGSSARGAGRRNARPGAGPLLFRAWREPGSLDEARPCRRWESIVIRWWIVLAITGPAILLALVFPWHGPPVRAAFWAYAAVSAGLSIGATVRAQGLRVRS